MRGLAIGVLALVLIVALMLGVGWLAFRTEPGTLGQWAGTLLRDLLLLGLAAAFEEAFFRGYPFQVLARAAGPIIAALVGSLLFAWAHASNPNVDRMGFVNIFLAGLMLSTAYLTTRSLWFTTGIHLGWNWAMASLADLPVSGLELMNTPLYEPRLLGPTWFTGGAFGPEGGLAGTVGFLLAGAAVWWLRKRQQQNKADLALNE
jgi:membrane protease YdiL (CAAX protease family)